VASFGWRQASLRSLCELRLAGQDPLTEQSAEQWMARGRISEVREKSNRRLVDGVVPSATREDGSAGTHEEHGRPVGRSRA